MLLTIFLAIVFCVAITLMMFAALLFILVVTGKTDLPRWACVFNTLPAFLILVPTKVPAKGNIANAFMFLGLAFLI